MTPVANYSVLAVALCLAAASGQSPVQVSAAQEADSYKPSLGDLMATVQLRHSKLWYAASLGNWTLAHYELEQLISNLRQVRELYPDVPASDLIETDRLTVALESAIGAKDKAEFEASFDRLTDECNACHRKADRGFITMRRPALPSPYSNQLFAPAQ